MKKTLAKTLSVILTLTIVAILITGCGCEANTASPDEATESTAIFASAPAATTAVDAAIADEGLTVNENGDIVDEKGNKVKTNEDGKIEVKTADGETVEVDAEDIKASNEIIEENKAYEEAQKKSSNSSGASNGSASKSTTTSSKASAGNTGSSSTSKTGTSSKSGSTSSKSNTTSSSTTSKSGSTSSKTGSSTSSKTTSSAQSSASSSKTYHEAVYKYIEHPAETKQVWVVDKEAYSYEEPVYEEQRRAICNDCGADITNNIVEHSKNHALNGGDGSYSVKTINVQVGTKTVEVPEGGHYETVVVKEAWTEKVLVKEAGWY